MFASTERKQELDAQLELRTAEDVASTLGNMKGEVNRRFFLGRATHGAAVKYADMPPLGEAEAAWWSVRAQDGGMARRASPTT